MRINRSVKEHRETKIQIELAYNEPDDADSIPFILSAFDDSMMFAKTYLYHAIMQLIQLYVFVYYSFTLFYLMIPNPIETPLPSPIYCGRDKLHLNSILNVK